MRQLTYALWLKNKTDFNTQPGLINVITAAFNGINRYTSHFTFSQYPPEFEYDIQEITAWITNSEIPINDKSFISLIQFGLVRTYIANIHLPLYGDDSFIRFVFYGVEPVAQQFDFSGSDFISLTISVDCPQNVFLTGSNPIFRSWDPINPIPLVCTGGVGGPRWTMTFPMLAGQTVEYKLLTAIGQYEHGPNRIYTASDADAQISITL